MENLNFFNLTNLTEKEARKENSQKLAFIGDAVYSLYVRNKIVLNNNCKTNELHKLTSEIVKAGGQSEFVENILNVLNEQELEVYKRARNYKTANVAKNAKVTDYKRATGLEALIGYLYLYGNLERINQIFEMMKD